MHPPCERVWQRVKLSTTILFRLLLQIKHGKVHRNIPALASPVLLSAQLLPRIDTNDSFQVNAVQGTLRNIILPATGESTKMYGKGISIASILSHFRDKSDKKQYLDRF
jgi:hypothetical protein